MSEADINELVKVRREKLEALRAAGIEPFAYKYEPTSNAKLVLEKFKDIKEGDESSEEVSLAGRIVLRRGHGKAAFAHIQDQSGRIQIYGKLDSLGKDKYELFEKLDMGDIIGVKGNIFKTRTGEVTVRVQDFTLLTKSLQPLPEKWHGLQDKELRYRQRYVDLIVNPDVRAVFIKRGQIISEVRKFLSDRGFLEVETPVLHTQAGGAAARPFATFHNTLGMDLYLRIALELHLKRLVVGGFERVFEIGRVFRNEGMDYKHNPEYTMLEMYQVYADYEQMMSLVEELVSAIAVKVTGSTKITYQGKEVDFKPPWKRLSLVQALKEHGGIDISHADFGSQSKQLLDDLRKIAKDKGLEVDKGFGVGKIVNLLYDKFVEGHLIQPTFIVDYPIETSPLAKKKRGNPHLVERFEAIVAGMELINAFTELNDPLDQRARFEEQAKLKKAGDEEAESLDEDFVRALEYGMPPTGGVGIGIDRLVMLLTDQHSIRDVLLFPHMRAE